MDGRRPSFRPTGRSSGGQHPQQQPPPPPPGVPHMQRHPADMDPNFNPQLQSVFLQNLANNMLQNLAYQQGFVPQNPNYPIQNFASMHPHHQPLPNSSVAQQLYSFSAPPPMATRPPLSSSSSEQWPEDSTAIKQTPTAPPFGKDKSMKMKQSKQLLEKIDRTAEKARRNLVAAGEGVTTWKVSQNVLLALQVDSWESLGFRMQEIPSLHRLILTEGKVNAFIHCFVAVWRIASLYDLQVAVCRNEGVERFEDLDLGPLLQHPLVLHYLVNSNVTEVFQITREDIISDLHEFMDSIKKKQVKVDEFLDFIAKKRSVADKAKLGVRIQNLGIYISFIREAKRSEDEALKKWKIDFVKNSDNTSTKLPPVNHHKNFNNLEERFSAICQRVESFSSSQKVFCGKHVRFGSSSSEDEESDDCSGKNEMTPHSQNGPLKIPSQDLSGSFRVNSCPYPSATEERSRLGLKVDVSQSSHSADGKSIGHSNKRKHLIEEGTVSAPSKFCKVDKLNQNDMNEASTSSDDSAVLSDNTMKTFIATWKDACNEYSVDKVVDKMLKFYNPADYKTTADSKTIDRRMRRTRKGIKSAMLSQPFIGLLNVAVSSIKLGMWDSIYDTFQAITQQDSQGYENIDVEAEEKHTSVDVKAERKGTPGHSEQNRQTMKCISVEDIVAKIAMYCELDHEFWSNCKSGVENRFIFMQKLCSCEDWLVCQFGVNEFNSLGHDEFFVFLEKNVSFLPAQVRNFLGNEPCESPSLEVRILQDQLILLVSQASNNLWQNEPITKQMISAMFARQFPSLSANVTGDCSSERFLATVEKHKSCAISNSVLFSATLQESHHNLDQLAHSESRGLATSASAKMSISSVTSKAAIDVLLQAPMLSDLNLWSHWDLRFAQSLGSLQHFLSREVTTRELICLVTREGKVIRLRHSATADTFLEAAVQGSPFQTAVELLSFFSLTGGEKHVPLSLLKSYSCHAFGVILNIPTNNVDVQGCVDNYVVPVTGSKDLNTPVSVAARFFLDCIGYFPAEFRGFVADVLLAGMQSLTFEASSAIFLECSGAERLMLREIGLSIDVSEWVNDHDTSGVGSTHLPNISESLHMDVSRSELSTKPRCKQDVTNENRLASSVEFSGDNGVTNSSPAVDIALVSGQTAGSGLDSNNDKDKDAASVIDCIRRSEFGLIPNLSSLESDMLTKQHARLGRALHCLSQELYSQDSHFLLELVQNADDNTYPENMEPTLVFILEESGIVVLNNEHGFSPQNIKALCDVGNSTKKRSGAGYIGKKGIGFKSVFRVTDAPQIHSNGFHIKFDISVGQIGFVLPTVVSPCNVDFYNGLVSGGNDQLDSNCWNTCIVLPFRSKLLAETTMRMFVDLHPSLLLFLHRLKCIMFRNMLNNSLVIMRKEIVGDGIVNVTWGEDKMTWLVASQKLQAHSSRPKVQATEIAIAFTLKESENSYYTPCLEQQPVFAFLPLRAYGLKFILQGDFILTSSREEVDRNNPWNEWLLANFPLLFAAAEKSFCALSCFKEKPGKAVTTFMSFVPLLGEVHGFFSGLPRAISLKLSTTECLFLEGDATKMVKPDKVLRGWNEEARILLPEVLLQKHLGLGFLDQNIVLRDSLASVLGITQYGPDILIRFTTCLCRTGNGLQLMGMRWLSFLLDALYRMLPNSNEENSLLDSLRGLPFVPLSDGTYSSSDAGTIWLHSDVLSTGLHGPLGLDTFPKLYAELRIVNPVLLSASATNGASPHNIVRMLERIGVQPLSAHEIMKLHIFQSISDFSRDRQSMTDYLCFLMIHIQSSCNMCHTERKSIMSELKSKAYILTNNGYKRLGEAPIHFSREFGNPIDVRKFNDVLKMEWNEVDVSYLKHPSIESLSGGLTKWREFLMEIGVTDFVQVVQTERSVTELSRAGINQMLCDAKLISPDHMAKDWESKELVHLLSLLSARNDAKCCEHVLDILDTLWDGSFSDKVSGFCNGNACDDLEPFKSSFISSLCDAQWLVSSIDNELHYPKDLFHDCETVRSILGSFAPYATPKVKSATLLADIGLKTKVGLTDALKIAEAWRKSNTPFKASISQMSRFYSFISEELVSSKKNVQEAFQSGPFIFVPFKTASKHNNLVSGVFLRPEEVYWDDPTGSLHQMKLLQQRTSTTMHQNPSDKTLCHVYPGLHDFFVNQCGVCETPSNSSYLDILRQLSTLAPPFEPASAVFKVFSKWGSGFKSGLLSSADLIHLKECLLKLEYTILPTASNKWMSLHTSFGVVCWCDNAELSKDFEHLDNINFLYFGKLKDNEEEILHKQVSELLRVLGIPALSEVISRQAIYYGPTDSSLKASLIHWALPYAQRYMYSIYPNNYAQLQQNGFEAVKKLKVVVVETLFYKNVIKRCGNSSQNRCECSCLLQDETLYSTMAADPHALFLELSRLFLNGTPDLHLANFLHMITTMAESGSTVDQTEFFILNCQKIPKLPEEEVVWSLGPSPSREKGETDTIFPMAMDEEETCIKPKVVSSTIENVSKSLKYQMKAGLRSNWPPADWKTAPGYGPHAGNSTLSTEKVADMILTQGEVPIIRDDSETSTYPGCEPVNDYLSLAYNNQTGGLDRTDQPQRLSSPSVFSRRDQFAITGGSSDQAMATGRLGEQIGFRYLTEKYGKEAVRWVNEAQETGLPYDMVVTEHGHGEQYIEVKATQSVRKDYFFISAREWQFAVEKGDAYTILHILLGNHNAMVTLFKNPVKQCQQGKLRLVVVMPTQQSGGELFPVLDA